MPTLTLLSNIELEALARAIRQEKEIKVIQIGNEEVKVSLFADEMIILIENPTDWTKILLETIKNTVNLKDAAMYKNPLLFYILTMYLQKKKWKRFSSAISTQRIKYLGINLTKDVKDLYTENYPALLKEIEKDTMK